MHDMFIEPLEAFAKNEILPLKDVKKGFEKAGSEADFALSRYMSKRPKDSMIADASSEVSDTRREFHYRYLDYVIKINQLEAKKKFEFMEYARTEYNNDIKESQQLKRSLLENAQETYNPLHSFKAGTKYRAHQGSDATIVKKSGHLFMKGNQRVMQSWTRKYFTISEEQLNYCTENQQDMEDWIYCLQTAAEEALYTNQMPKFDSSGMGKLISQDTQRNDINSNNQVNYDSSQSIQQSILRIKQLPGNECCVDCKSKGNKVRSLMLDKWEPESLEVMSKLGNFKVNQIFEAKLVGDNERKLMNSSWEREKFIIDKYVNKEFVVQKDEKIDLSNSVDLVFWKAMSDSNLHEALRCLSLGANVDWKNDKENYTTALHQAILRSDDVA
ncbi:4399_t:CDS:10, partial [Racocetra fulgida]